MTAPSPMPLAVPLAGLLAFAGPLTFFAGASSVLGSAAGIDLAWLGLWWTLYAVSFWLALLAAGHACERMASRLGRRAGTALWLVAAPVAAVVPNLLTAGRATILMEQGLVHSAATMHLHGFTISLVMALLYFAHLRRSRRHEQAAARLAAAQAAQRGARRRAVEARLQALQGRIDPQILFEMLESARRLYERDHGLAEQFLDELVLFLRAALPGFRATSSSLPREAELARAFVRLRARAGAAELDLAFDVAPEARHARFPPGVLLPLLDAAVASGARPCRLVARRSGESCRVVLRLDGPPSSRSVARTQSLLSELYGPAGTLQVERAEGGTHVVMEVPYELA